MKEAPVNPVPVTSPEEVARCLLALSGKDHREITPLQLQKLVYYAYAWVLVVNKRRLFEERIEAWPNGPVVPSLYRKLKTLGSSPIPENFLRSMSEEEMSANFPHDVLETIRE